MPKFTWNIHVHVHFPFLSTNSYINDFQCKNVFIVKPATCQRGLQWWL